MDRDRRSPPGGLIHQLAPPLHGVTSAVDSLGGMSDAFVPEADRLDQQREVAPSEDTDPETSGRRAAQYPTRVPLEASEADVLEQTQTVEEPEE